MTRRTSSAGDRHRALAVPAAAGALVLVLAACGGGAGASTGEDDGEAALGTGPLDAYFERIYEEAWVDPNQAYVDAMTEGERDAYYVALYGDQTGPEEGAEEEWEYDWTTAGCQGSSQHAIEEKYGLGGEEMTALQEEMEGLWAQISADERITALTSRWSDCMADAGYPGLAAMEDAQNAVMEEQNAIYEEVFEGAGEDADYEALDAEVQERTAALTGKEIATAVADFDCREEIEFDEVQVEVTNEYQQTFVDTHRAELDAWAESVEAARS
ncbi:hypothetical protein [Actinotalea sp. Marseille-Q4924]|uniref:hypothetical protein n=1 Tax=Actinotalea sp. Marseille-Q4924 TaxID=2866571 RepID=UPI001CE46AE9|nr:hypothetical protein [Actinotalea sp. Marseille-Q4924]